MVGRGEVEEPEKRARGIGPEAGVGQGLAALEPDVHVVGIGGHRAIVGGEGLRQTAEPAQEHGQGHAGRGVAGGQERRLLQGRRRFVAAAEGSQAHALLLPGRGVLRVHGQGLIGRRHRLLGPARHVQRGGPRRADGGRRRKRARAPPRRPGARARPGRWRAAPAPAGRAPIPRPRPVRAAREEVPSRAAAGPRARRAGRPGRAGAPGALARHRSRSAASCESRRGTSASLCSRCSSSRNRVLAREAGAGRRRLEGRPARRGHLIQDDAEAVGVGALVGRGAFEALRGHVHGRLGSGHARLGDAQSAVQAHEQVRGLEVAVAAHARGVGVLEAAAGQDAQTQHLGEGDGVPPQPALEGAPHLGLAAVGIGRDVVVDHSLAAGEQARSAHQRGVGLEARPEARGEAVVVAARSPSRRRRCPSPRSRRGRCAPRRRGDARGRRGPAPPKASRCAGSVVGGRRNGEVAGGGFGRAPAAAGGGEGTPAGRGGPAPSRSGTRRGRASVAVRRRRGQGRAAEGTTRGAIGHALAARRAGYEHECRAMIRPHAATRQCRGRTRRARRHARAPLPSTPMEPEGRSSCPPPWQLAGPGVCLLLLVPARPRVSSPAGRGLARPLPGRPGGRPPGRLPGLARGPLPGAPVPRALRGDRLDPVLHSAHPRLQRGERPGRSGELGAAQGGRGLRMDTGGPPARTCPRAGGGRVSSSTPRSSGDVCPFPSWRPGGPCPSRSPSPSEGARFFTTLRGLGLARRARLVSLAVDGQPLPGPRRRAAPPGPGDRSVPPDLPRAADRRSCDPIVPRDPGGHRIAAHGGSIGTTPASRLEPLARRSLPGAVRFLARDVPAARGGPGPRGARGAQRPHLDGGGQGALGGGARGDGGPPDLRGKRRGSGGVRGRRHQGRRRGRPPRSCPASTTPTCTCLMGALALDQVDLIEARDLPAVQARVKAFAEANPKSPWVRGRGWLYGSFPGGLPTKEQLDAAVKRPPRLHGVLRRPQRLGQLEGPGPGGHHEGHEGPRERRDRPRPQDGRAHGRPQGVRHWRWSPPGSRSPGRRSATRCSCGRFGSSTPRGSPRSRTRASRARSLPTRTPRTPPSSPAPCARDGSPCGSRPR